jgi:hypothetical protein
MSSSEVASTGEARIARIVVNDGGIGIVGVVDRTHKASLLSFGGTLSSN